MIKDIARSHTILLQMIGIIKSLHPFHMNEAKDVINPLAILGAKPSGGTPQAFQEIV